MTPEPQPPTAAAPTPENLNPLHLAERLCAAREVRWLQPALLEVDGRLLQVGSGGLLKLNTGLLAEGGRP